MIVIPRRARTGLAATAAAVLVSSAALFGAAPAHAAKCPPASVGGKSVGAITAGDVSVPIKRVSYVPGGALRPPATNQAVGLSTLNAPLDAQQGTTVLAWHVRYGRGCPGTLNTLLAIPIGGTFTVTSDGTGAREYRITERVEVPKGRYKRSWFSPDGPHRLALFTCGDLRSERFNSTVATFAEPVT